MLRELAADRTERETAELLGMSYHGVRSIVVAIRRWLCNSAKVPLFNMANLSMRVLIQ